MIKTLKYIYITLMLVFLYAPILVLIIFSFNESRSRANWTGFSFNWYAHLFRDQQITNALTVTLVIAVITVIFAVIIGTFAAIGIHNLSAKKRRTRYTKSSLLTFTKLSMSSPEIVIGISLMLFFIYIFSVLSAGEMGFYTLLFAHIIFSVPYVVMSVLPKLRQADQSLYAAALDLGAPPLRAFFSATLPQIKPGIITAAMITFTLSIDDIVISYFTSGTTSNLSVMIFSMVRFGINPTINALSTIMFLAVMLFLYIIHRFESHNTKKYSKITHNAK